MDERREYMKKKIGRNDPCPCGSGKKYKFCCINKMSEEEIQALYLEQFELTKGLNDVNRCQKILDIGKRIIEHQQNSICATGTYVNMAVAKRVLYLLNHKRSDLEDAKDFCSHALELKHNNQAALKTMYGICLELKQYGDANKALEQYEDTNLYSSMSMQIIAEYQNAIEWANREVYREENKKGLDEITNTLFEKFGMNAGLCAVAVSYYLGIGNDMLKAYELGKRSVEEYPDSATYNSLGWICLTPEINRKDIAVGFFEKAIELAEDEEVKKDITGNYFIALLENEQYKKAENVISELIDNHPCNQNFSNYAEMLKRQGKLEEALEWGKKALFIVEDDITLLLVADVYKKMKQYENAVFMYKKCLEYISSDENVYQFKDVNGRQLYSIASDNSLDMIMFEALKGIISVYSLLKEYEQAKAYLLIAKEKLPQKSEWEIWEQTLPEIENVNQRYLEIKEQFNQSSKKIVEQKCSVRRWALQLIQIQNSSGQLNLEENDDWEKYLEKMDEILNQMVQTVNKNSTIYQNCQNWVNSTYAHLDTDAKEFLITAEALYEIHKMSIIDFAPIIVEYCKVVEKQLRVLLGSQLPSNKHMLGQIIGVISNNNIHPYNLYLSDLQAVNQLRRNSAHTGLLTKNDADTIRNIFYTNNLLNNLV